MKKFEVAKKALDIELSNIDIYVKPTKGVHSGLAGDDYEVHFKSAIGCTKGELISKQGKCDTFKTVKGVRYGIECKTGAGSFESVKFNAYETIGNNAVALAKALKMDTSKKVMVYTPEYAPFTDDETLLKTSYVIPYTVLYEVALSGKKVLRVTPSRPTVVRFSSDFKTYVFKIIEKYGCPTAKEFFEV